MRQKEMATDWREKQEKQREGGVIEGESGGAVVDSSVYEASEKAE